MELEPIGGAKTAPPPITKFTSYRQIMRAWYEHKRSLRSGLSFRRFSHLVGLKSPNFLQMVMDGKRNLSLELAPRVAKVLGFTTAERQYFIGLIKKELATVPEDCERANREILSAIRKMTTVEIPNAKSQILAHWYYMVVRELTFLPDFKPTGEWISQRLRGLITNTQAENALELLLKSGFLVKSKSGHFTPVDPVIDTADKAYQGAVVNCHVEVFKVWGELLPSIDAHQREVGLINIPMNHAKVEEFKTRIRQFQDEIIGWLQDEKNPDVVMQLGTYLLPISR